MTFHNRISTNPSTVDAFRFCKPESLLLDGFRLWAQSPDNMAHIRRRWRAYMTEMSLVRSTKAMRMMSHVIGLNARRTVYLMPPGVVGATADERCILALIGAQLHGRRAQAGALATWLLPISCHGTVLALAGELGRALAASGLDLAPPRDAAFNSSPDVNLRIVA